MAQPGRIVAAIDVGNHRVLALIGELDNRRELVIRGVGLARSAGVRTGQIVQMAPVVEAIRVAVEEAELMAKVPLERVYASVAGTFLSGRMTRATITLGGRPREVTRTGPRAAQRRRAPPAAAAGPHRPQRAHPQLRPRRPGRHPRPAADCVGQQLAVDAYVLACQESPVRDPREGDQRRRPRGRGVPLRSPVAAALATLTATSAGSARSSSTSASATPRTPPSPPTGCSPPGASRSARQKINDDLVHCFQTTDGRRRERASATPGPCCSSDVGAEETISVPTIDGRANHVVSRLELCQTVARLRMQEILEHGRRRRPPTGARRTSSFTGLVLSGGGAHLEGLAALAEEVFVMRARLGELEDIADATQLLNSSELPSRSPAVAAGLLAHARRTAVSARHAGTARPSQPRRRAFAACKKNHVQKGGGQ